MMTLMWSGFGLLWWGTAGDGTQWSWEQWGSCQVWTELILIPGEMVLRWATGNRLFLSHLKLSFFSFQIPLSHLSLILLYALIWIIQLQWKRMFSKVHLIISAFPWNFLRLWFFTTLQSETTKLLENFPVIFPVHEIRKLSPGKKQEYSLNLLKIKATA